MPDSLFDTSLCEYPLITLDEAKKVLAKARKEKLPIVDDEGNLKKVNFKSMNLINGELDANIIRHLTSYIDTAKGFVQEYITARKGKFFGPIHDMGSRRLNAAKDLNDVIKDLSGAADSLTTELTGFKL